MSFIKRDIPLDVLRAFTSGLGNYIDSSDPLWALLLNNYSAIPAYHLTRKTFDNIELAAPPPADLSDVLARTNLPQAGWRFLAAQGNLYGGCHVGSINEGHPPKLTGLSTATQVLTAIESLNELEAVAPPGNFEARVLRIPWLHFEAFWLHSQQAKCSDCIDYDRDWLVPYAGFIGKPHYGLDLMQPFTVEKFFGGLWEPRIRKAIEYHRKKQAEEATLQAELARALASAHETAVKGLKERADVLDREAAAAQRRANPKPSAGANKLANPKPAVRGNRPKR